VPSRLCQAESRRARWSVQASFFSRSAKGLPGLPGIPARKRACRPHPGSPVLVLAWWARALFSRRKLPQGGGVSAARRNRGKGEQESSQEGTSVSYDHTQELFRFCRILRPWCRVLRRGPDPIDSIAVHCVFRHLHRLILLHMPLLINTTPVQPLDSTTDKEVKNTAFWPLPCPI